MRLGATKNVVAVLDLDMDALDFLIVELPQSDGFTRDLYLARERILEAQRIEADVARFGVAIVMVPR